MKLTGNKPFVPFMMKWVSNEMKGMYEESIRKAASAYSAIEALSVKHRLRSCKLEMVPHQNFDHSLREFAKDGMTFVPTRKVKSANAFSHSLTPPDNNDLKIGNWMYYGILSNNISDCANLIEAEAKNDHIEIGKYLGFSECCSTFFKQHWDVGYIDPIWQQFQNVSKGLVVSSNDNYIETNGYTPWQTNVALRYLGIRAVPHIPCSPDCKYSVEMADKWIQLGRDLRIEGVEELVSFLKMELEWSVLDGEATITTPLFTLKCQSVASESKYTTKRSNFEGR